MTTTKPRWCKGSGLRLTWTEGPKCGMRLGFCQVCDVRMTAHASSVDQYGNAIAYADRHAEPRRSRKERIAELKALLAEGVKR